MIVYSILVDLTRLSGLSRNQGDERCSYQSPREPPRDPPGGRRAPSAFSRSAGWREGVRDGDGDLYFLRAVTPAFPKLLEQNLVAGLIP